MLTVIGEALIDEVVHPGAEPVPHVGGSPLNVAVGLARLGHPVEFLGRYGQDAYGELIAAHLHGNSVLTPLAADALATSVARANLDADGAASYQFQLAWTLPEVTSEQLQATTLLHTGSIAAMLSPGADAVYQAVLAARGHATISYDPNCRPSIIKNVAEARERAEKFVRLADVVKASDEDLHWLYPESDPLDSARNWLGYPDGPALVVVTRGEGGPWAVAAAAEVTADVPAVQVADTVGAGDSFMAALIGAIVDRELDGAQRREQLRAIGKQDLADILNIAAHAAAITVSRPGANPPTKDELHNFGR
ncbi:fructokinase [Renibacterium salmoninarum ATCC 33209]|uniref:Fructokinase n=1 Tax=Renibacterium salmoninarum (strain ATCC 33209 / DSM 20767 / JCM 11484 / NBRC 15589 / NCIMB 2235) TaxID=288705 RepID=A9WKP1_RENSM|nr:carbohydrate kinase [Renibacterium salmoninarum]ABY21850.1 fructokinase [Renibacterium salmoninarum ATCC 33209]